LTDELNCVCFAMVSGKGMVITWGKQDPSHLTEGLHIHIYREKMLELARAILDACKEEKEAWEDFARTHPEVVDWKVELQHSVNDPIYKKGLLKLPKLSEEVCESFHKVIEESNAIPQICLPPCDDNEGEVVVKDIDSETVETMLTVILDEIGQLRKAIEDKKEGDVNEP